MAEPMNKPGRPASAADKPPPDQCRADLITRELDKNVLVEAAAGTGQDDQPGRAHDQLDTRQGECQRR